MGQDATPRKRRDNLADQMGKPVYTPEPLPPYIFMIEGLVYCCTTFDRALVLPFMPPGLTPVAGNTATICFYRHRQSWGMSDVWAGFFSVVVEECPAPDTGEAAYFMLGVMEAPAQTLAATHYGDFRSGNSTRQTENDEIHATMSLEGREIARAVIRINGPENARMGAVDRYIGWNQAGELVSSLVSTAGSSFPAELISLTIAEDAPPQIRAMAPVGLNFAVYNEAMLTGWSAPEPLSQVMDGPQKAPREALMAVLTGLGRGACILSIEGRILHRNDEAARLLAGTACGAMGRMDLALPDLSRVLASLAARPPGPLPGPMRLVRGSGLPPLIVQLAPIDPALAGQGTVLMLLNDPAARRDPAWAELLQLLELTPAEARVAAAVGSGMSPREAAVRLGLTEATVRSTLKVVYDKLGVRRQAELVRLVGRLDPG